MTQITVPNVPTFVVYSVPTSSVGPFTVPFAFFDEEDVKATVIDIAGAETPLVVTTDFTFTTLTTPPGQEGTGYSGGAITLLVAVGATGTTIRIYRDTVIDRTANFPSTGPFSMPILNDEQNNQIMILQEIAEETDAFAADILANTAAIISNDVDIANNVVNIANNTTAINDLVVAVPGFLYPLSAGEIDQSISPADYSYPPGNVFRYGAVGDGVTDDIAAIQQACDQAIAANALADGSATVVFPLGQYSITEPIRLYRLVGTYQFFSCTLKGESSQPYIGLKSSQIIPTYSDNPALLIQGARVVELNNLMITGKNVIPVPSALNIVNGTDGTLWNITGCRDSTYSPYCGIAIDPFREILPPDGGYPDLVAEYVSRTTSRGVSIINCRIDYFVVGIISSPNGNTQLGDQLTIENCNISLCKTSIAMCQDQLRDIRVNNLYVTGAHTVFNNRRYGQSTGIMPYVTNANINFVKYFCRSAGSWGATASIKNLYAELICSLGKLDSNSQGINFEGCTFKFWDMTADAIPGPAIPVHIDFEGSALFLGCNFFWYNNTINKINVNNSKSLTFINTVFDGYPTFKNNPGSGGIDHPKMINCSNRYQGEDRYTDVAHISDSLMKGYVPPFMVITTATSSYRASGGEDNLTFAAMTFTNNGDGSGSFSDATAAAQLLVKDHIVSDTIWSYLEADEVTLTDARRLYIGRVSSIAAPVVNLKMVPPASQFPSGVYTLSFRERFRAKSRSYGDILNTNADITNVVNTATWSINDRIKGLGIQAGTYITNIVGSTITMSQVATATNTLEAIYHDDLLQFNYRRSSVPTTGNWFKGDKCENSVPTIDGNNMILAGWLCTVTGTPGTWLPYYISTATPAT